MCFSYESRKKGFDAVTVKPEAKTETGKIEMKFKIGDKVKITRKAAGGENGWRNLWIEKMDSAVGKIGKIVRVQYYDNEYDIEVPGVSGTYGYPPFVLEAVTETRVFKKGDRVNVTWDGSGYWDGLATVKEVYATGDVSVLTDKGRTGAFAPEKLTLVPVPVTKEEYQYKVGDRVNVNYTPDSNWNGPGTVSKIGGPFIRVKPDHRKPPFTTEGAFLKKEISLISPAPTAPTTKFQVGDRVQVTKKRGGVHSGVPAIVYKIDPTFDKNPDRAMYYIKSDRYADTPGYYGENLELVSPKNPVAPVSQPTQVYEIAKNIAVDIAKTNSFVNADLVQDGLAKLGYTPGQLGNAAGSIFRSKQFEKIGTVKSTRPGNNRREIFNYRYIGA